METTRRTVYAEFLTSAADVCTTLSERPFDKNRSDSPISAFVGKAGAVVLVAPQHVQDAAQNVNDYLVEASSARPGANVPDDCDNTRFFSLTNAFLDVAEKELSY